MAKVRCNVCGHEFEFNGPGVRDAVSDIFMGIGQIGAALSGNIFTMSAASNVAKNTEFQLKCPKCKSTNVTGVFANADNSAAVPAITINANASIDALLKRAALFVEDEAWDTADVYFDQILDADPENCLAYIGKMLVQFHCHSVVELKNCKKPFDDNSYYKKALRFGDEETKATLQGYNKAIKARNERARKEELRLAEIKRKDDIYASAAKKMANASSKNDYQQVMEVFRTISGWKDADEQISICQNRIEEIDAKNKKNAKLIKKIAAVAVPLVCVIVIISVILNMSIKYNNAVALMESEKYSEASVVLSELNGYKDSDKLLVEALDNVKKEDAYQSALTMLADDNAESHGEAYEKLLELGDYKNSKEMLDKFQYLLISIIDDLNFSGNTSIETYQYGSSGYLVAGTYSYNKKTSGYQYKFNDQGQLLERRGANGYLLEFRYHSNGNVSFCSYPVMLNSEDKYIGFYETEYDTDGKVVSYKYKEEGKYKTVWTYDYHYDADGSITSVDIQYQHGKNEDFLTVDIKGMDLEIVVDPSGYSQPKYLNVSNDGKKETTYMVKWKDTELVLCVIEVSEYDEHHNPIISSYPDNTYPATYTYQYTYNAEGQIISRKSDSGGITEYTYDAYDNCIQEIYKGSNGEIQRITTRNFGYVYTPDAK